MSFRLDRFLTLYVFKPLSGHFKSRDLRIPIVMYHSISNEAETGHPYFWVNTSPARFAEHMKYLYDNNYQVISLSEAVALLSSFNSTNSMNPTNSRNSINPAAQQPHDSMTRRLNDPISQRSRYVVLTFDDGFHDFYTNAFPILNKHSYRATVFLSTGFINKERLSFKGKQCMTWDEIKQLIKDGISFGSHTVNHPQLHNLKKNEIDDEIKSSKKKIEDEIGIKIDSFSYPFAFPQEDQDFVIRYKEKLVEYGYRVAVTTTIGRASINDDPLILKRIPVNNADDSLLFPAKLEGAYDWLYRLQYVYKLIKGRFQNNV